MYEGMAYGALNADNDIFIHTWTCLAVYTKAPLH